MLLQPRFITVLSFLFVFLVTVLLAFMHIGTGQWTNTQQLLEMVLPAESAFLGVGIALTK